MTLYLRQNLRLSLDLPWCVWVCIRLAELGTSSLYPVQVWQVPETAKSGSCGKSILYRSFAKETYGFPYRSRGCLVLTLVRTKHVHLHGSISFYWFVDTDSDSELVWSPPSHLVWLDPSAQQVPFQRMEGCLEWLKLDLIALLGLLAFGCWEWPGLTMLKWWATNDLRSRSGLHNIQFTGKGLKPYEGFRISEPSTVSETSNRTGIQLLNDVKSTSRFLHHLHVSVACQRSSTEWESLEKPIETPPGSQGPLKHPSLSPWLVDGDVVLTPLAPLTELGCQGIDLRCHLS